MNESRLCPMCRRVCADFNALVAHVSFDHRSPVTATFMRQREAQINAQVLAFARELDSELGAQEES